MIRAVYSGQKVIADELGHRYVLMRTWRSALAHPRNRIAWIGLNPAPLGRNGSCRTLTMIERISRAEGYDSFVIVNLYALISSSPRLLRMTLSEAIGSRNDEYICNEVAKAQRIVCTWGDECGIDGFKERERSVLKLLNYRRLYCLEVTNDGHPVHVSRINEYTGLHIWQHALCND